MIKYICRCNKCDGAIWNTSECPNGNRAELLETAVYYCDMCNAPAFYDTCPECRNKLRRIGTDLRPVFAQERLLLEVLLDKPMEFAGKAVWATSSTTYWIDGEKLKINLTEFKKKDSQEVIEKLEQYKDQNKAYVDTDFSNEHIKSFIQLNRVRLNEITDEAIKYIQEMAKPFLSDNQMYQANKMFVSFSGGKDSTVTSHLVMKALQAENIPHIYGDTTLEYPASAAYIKEFRKKYPKTPVFTAKNKDQDFEDLCEVVGPPSRVMRWCCTVFKTGAITQKIETMYKNEPRLLSFQGIRRSESVSRSKYERSSSSSKISKQLVAAPIIDWMDFDVWLYILANELPFNGAYRQGFQRVGCWCCPNNSSWAEFLSSIYMPEEYVRFREMLYGFARKVGKEDWKDYIDEGKWKARQGGNGLDYSKNTVVSFKPCALEADAYNFELNKPISEELYTLFKPFGKIDHDMGNKRLNEVYVLNKKTGNPVLKLTGRIGATTLRITVLDKSGPFKNSQIAEQTLNGQITKYQMCIGCGYCQSVCKFNALKVSNTDPGNVSNQSIKYTINSNICVGCLECVKHFDGGCYMKKVLRIKKGQ